MRKRFHLLFIFFIGILCELNLSLRRINSFAISTPKSFFFSHTGKLGLVLNPSDGLDERDDLSSFFSFSNNAMLFNIPICTTTEFNTTFNLINSTGESISHYLHTKLTNTVTLTGTLHSGTEPGPDDWALPLFGDTDSDSYRKVSYMTNIFTVPAGTLRSINIGFWLNLQIKFNVDSTLNLQIELTLIEQCCINVDNFESTLHQCCISTLIQHNQR